MAKMGIRIVIVVEDRMLDRFCREALLQLGYHKREIRVESAPSGRGSGKKWVTDAYVKEVRIMRSKPYQQLAVLVGSDVDELELRDRVEQLAAALQEAALDKRGDGERIAYWLPRWSIETWLKRLDGEDVDETTKYKHTLKNPDLRKAAQQFVAKYRSHDDPGLPALQSAFSEVSRIEA